MSDDQGDSSNKSRRSRIVDPETAAASEQAKARKEKPARKAKPATPKKTIAPAKSVPGEKAKVQRKTAKKTQAEVEPHTADGAEPALSDEEKAKAKAERKAEKATKKLEVKAARHTADSAAPALSDEEKARAKAERKAEKAAKKLEVKAARHTADSAAPALSDEEKAKAKAERKAEKAAKKLEVKAVRHTADSAAPALSDEEKAKAKAERKAEKAAKKVEVKAARHTADNAKPALSDEEKAKAKAERKAEKAAKKLEVQAARHTADGAAPALSDEEKAKAKAERKAEKAAKKLEVQAARHTTDGAEPALSDEEKAKAKAERKAEKAAKKLEVKAARHTTDGAEPALSDEEKAKAKAERKAEKAAKKVEVKAARHTADGAEPALSDEEKARAKAERKAEKAAKKLEVKAARHTADSAAPALSDEEKAKAKAERKAEKAAKKVEVKAARHTADGAEPALSDEEKARAKAERKAAKKAEAKGGRKGDSENDGEADDGPRELRITVRGLNEESMAGIRARIEAEFTAAGTAFAWAKEDDKPGLAIYGFENPAVSAEEIGAQAQAIAQDRARFRIFIGRAGMPVPDGADAFAAENRAIAALAMAFDGGFVDTAALFQRYGNDTAITNGQATDIVVSAILGIAAGGRMSKSTVPYPQRPAPADLAEARALSAADLVAQLIWSNPSAPRLLWTHASKESMEEFLARKVVLSETQTLDLNVPIAWPAELPDGGGTKVFGLEFLAGPLNYWYSKAGNNNSRRISEIDPIVRERGAAASEILSYAGKIIVDFADKYPLSNSVAWRENAVSRRARVLALFVLCCKTAAKRKVKFDEAIFVRVFGELLNLIEVLRSSDFYEPGSFGGVQQDSLLSGLALALRKTAYAEKLLAEAIARLTTLQLNIALTNEGVWHAGPFSEHCTLLTEFKTMLGDFSQLNAALKEPIASAAKKMTVFAEALLKSDGSPPAFDDGHQKSYARKLSGTRRALVGAGFGKVAPQRGKSMPRLMDTYVFRDAQYFASHSTQKPSADSSLVVLHANPASVVRGKPGNIVLAFAYADTDLLVRAEPQEGTKKRDKSAHFDAALCNGYHVNGAGYAADEEIKPNTARLVKSWRGEGWAAAKSVDETNPAGTVVRTVVHLKAKHALVVVDQLTATGGNETAFEQFWHVAPGLSPADSAGTLLQFSAEAGGGLTVAFDPQGVTATEPEGEAGTCVRRNVRLAKGVVASLFQRTAEPGPAAINIVNGPGDGWSVEISGNGFEARLGLTGDELLYEPKKAD